MDQERTEEKAGQYHMTDFSLLEGGQALGTELYSPEKRGNTVR